MSMILKCREIPIQFMHTHTRWPACTCNTTCGKPLREQKIYLFIIWLFLLVTFDNLARDSNQEERKKERERESMAGNKGLLARN